MLPAASLRVLRLLRGPVVSSVRRFSWLSGSAAGPVRRRSGSILSWEIDLLVDLLFPLGRGEWLGAQIKVDR